jgi:hypothetical protein
MTARAIGVGVAARRWLWRCGYTTAGSTTGGAGSARTVIRAARRAGCVTAGGVGSAAACVAAGGAGSAGSTARRSMVAGRAVAVAGSTGTTVARAGKMENEIVFPGRAVKSLYLRRL